MHHVKVNIYLSALIMQTSSKTGAEQKTDNQNEVDVLHVSEIFHTLPARTINMFLQRRIHEKRLSVCNRKSHTDPAFCIK